MPALAAALPRAAARPRSRAAPAPPRPRAQARCLLASDAELAEAQARLLSGRDPSLPVYDSGVHTALVGAAALNAPNLGLARLLRRLAGSEVACALLADTAHAPAVCAAARLLDRLAPNDGSGGGFRLEPRQRRGGVARREKRAASAAAGGAEQAPGCAAPQSLPLLRLLSAAEAGLLSGGVRCSQLHGSPPCASAHVVGGAAMLRYLDGLASGRGPPALGDEAEAAMPTDLPLLARAASEVCNYEAVRRVARCARRGAAHGAVQRAAARLPASRAPGRLAACLPAWRMRLLPRGQPACLFALRLTPPHPSAASSPGTSHGARPRVRGVAGCWRLATRSSQASSRTSCSPSCARAGSACLRCARRPPRRCSAPLRAYRARGAAPRARRARCARPRRRPRAARALSQGRGVA